MFVPQILSKLNSKDGTEQAFLFPLSCEDKATKVTTRRFLIPTFYCAVSHSMPHAQRVEVKFCDALQMEQGRFFFFLHRRPMNANESAIADPFVTVG